MSHELCAPETHLMTVAKGNQCFRGLFSRRFKMLTHSKRQLRVRDGLSLGCDLLRYERHLQNLPLVNPLWTRPEQYMVIILKRKFNNSRKKDRKDETLRSICILCYKFPLVHGKYFSDNSA